MNTKRKCEPCGIMEDWFLRVANLEQEVIDLKMGETGRAGSPTHIIYLDGSKINCAEVITGDIVADGLSIDGVIDLVVSSGNYASGGFFVYPGNYPCVAKIKLPSYWFMTGCGEGTVIAGGFEEMGDVTTSISLMTANPAQGGLTVTVADGSKFAAGDFVKLYGTGADVMPPGTGMSYAGNYEGSIVKSVAGNVLTLEDKICNIYTTATNGAVVKITPVKDVYISNLKVEQSLNGNIFDCYFVDKLVISRVSCYNGNANQGIYIATGRNCVISDSLLYNMHDAINIEICSIDNVITHCKTYGGNGNGIDIALSSHNNVVKDCRIYNHHNQPGIAIEYNCDRNVIDNCLIDDCITNISITDNSNQNVVINSKLLNSLDYGIKITTSHKNTIKDCVISGCVDYGIYVYQSDYFVANNCDVEKSYTGCWIEESDYSQINGGRYYGNVNVATSRGMYFKNSEFGIISNSLVYNNNEHGILLSTNCHRFNIVNNIVHDNGKMGGAATQDGIVLATNCDYNIIKGNVVFNSPRAEINIYSADCNANMIYDNYVYGTNTFNINDSGTATVKNRNVEI